MLVQNDGPVGHDNGIELEVVPAHLHQSAILQSEVPQTMLENGDARKAHGSELNVEDVSTLEACKEPTSEDRLLGNESTIQSESPVLNKELQASNAKENTGQDRSDDDSPQGPERSDPKQQEEEADSSYVGGLLLAELDEAVLKQRFMTSAELQKEERSRMESKLSSRIREIKDLPAFSEEKVRQMNLIEQYSLDLLSLQKKVRAEVLQELRLKELCVAPDSRVYDWGLMRIRRSGTSYLGYGDAGKREYNPFVCLCF